MGNIYNFNTFPQRRRLMKGNGLVGNKNYFEADVRPDRGPTKFSAGELRRVGDQACKNLTA